jgi:hypothetical protein
MTFRLNTCQQLLWQRVYPDLWEIGEGMQTIILVRPIHTRREGLRGVHSIMFCGSGECLEVVSKPQVRLKSKAQADEKAQHTR